MASLKAVSTRGHIVRKSRLPAEGLFCSYSHRICMQTRLDGYEFCTKHILEDKNSPFKHCNYISKSGKRCGNAAPKADKRDGYCMEHARKVGQLRQLTGMRRRPKPSVENVLDDLERALPRSSDSRSKHDGHRSVLDYVSSTDSETDCPTVDHCWRGDGDSDAESVDSEQEDSLKHAGAYTAEEVALITRDKLIRLQSLYIDQFKRLQLVMKEKRRRYLHTVHGEREAYGSLHYAKDDAHQRDSYDKLVSMKRYHQRYGKEALLHRQSKERRVSVSEGANYKPPSYPKCIFSKFGVRCGARTIPLARHCMKHVLQDPHQVLYHPCSFGAACRQPVVSMDDHPSCVYHSQPSVQQPRLPVANDDEDSDVKIEPTLPDVDKLQDFSQQPKISPEILEMDSVSQSPIPEDANHTPTVVPSLPESSSSSNTPNAANVDEPFGTNEASTPLATNHLDQQSTPAPLRLQENNVERGEATTESPDTKPAEMDTSTS